MGGRNCSNKRIGNRQITIAILGLDNAGKTTTAKVLSKTSVFLCIKYFCFKNLIEYFISSLANKQDEKEALDKNTILKNLQILNENRTLYRMELCTAKLTSPDGKNSQMDPAIRNGFDWLIKTIYENYDILHERVEYDIQRRNEAEQKAKRERQEIVSKIREERAKQEGSENEHPTTDGFVPIEQAVKNAEKNNSTFYTNINNETT